MTAEAFNLFSQSGLADFLFNKFFVIFTKAQWIQLLTLQAKPIDEWSCGLALRKHWTNFSVTSEDLDKIDKKFPDILCYCGTQLKELYAANQILGDDMIFTPVELARLVID